MLLKIEDRFVLLNVLPAESDVATLRIALDLKRALSFSERELKEKFIRPVADGFEWGDPELEGSDMAVVNKPVDIQIGERASDVIKLALQQFSSQGKLRAEFLPLYDHFVEGKGWPPTQEVQDAESNPPIAE